MSIMSNQPVYKIIFHNGKQIFEVYAKHIYQSDMWGFVEIEEMLFGERSAILVDPGEEKLKSEFSGVKRSYIPMQSIIRIDEVEKQGAAKVSEGAGLGKNCEFPTNAQLCPQAHLQRSEALRGKRAVTMARIGAGWPSTVLL